MAVLVTLMLLNTLPRYGEGRDYHEDYNDAFVAWELVFNIIFLVEFIVRVAVGEHVHVGEGVEGDGRAGERARCRCR